MDIYESLGKLAAASAEEFEEMDEDHMDDDLINQEDPYLQSLLSSLEEN